MVLSRALSDLKDQGWLVHTGQHYEVTPLGAVSLVEFRRLLDYLEAAGR